MKLQTNECITLQKFLSKSPKSLDLPKLDLAAAASVITLQALIEQFRALRVILPEGSAWGEDGEECFAPYSEYVMNRLGFENLFYMIKIALTKACGGGGLDVMLDVVRALFSIFISGWPFKQNPYLECNLWYFKVSLNLAKPLLIIAIL